MSSSKNKPQKEKLISAEKKEKSVIPLKYQTLLALSIILVVFAIYYAPMYFGNQTFSSGDIITAHSATTYIDNKHEEFTLWYPYIFCGIPGYALNVGYKWFNLMWVGLSAARTIFTSLVSTSYAMWSLYLIILAVTTFFLVQYLTKNRLISLFAGLSTAFTTGIVLFIMAGHVTKLTALCFFPLILLMLIKFEKKIKLRDVAILIIALQLSMQGWHVQIIFYMLFSIGIYFAYYIAKFLIEKNHAQIKQFFKSGIIFTGAFLIALAIQSDNLTQIYEYNTYSTRGTKGILEQEKTDVKGNDSDFYQYATNWSFSPGELATFIVPSFYGFGKSTYEGPLTQNQPTPVNTYFGQMSYVEVPMYMGVVVLFLALFGIYSNRKNSFVQYLTILSAIAILISFGRTFSPVFDLMFYYFPFFDKFRVPSMILVIPQMVFPILAAYGIKSIVDINTKKDLHLEKVVKYTAYTFTALLLLSFLGSGVISDWFAGRINDYAAVNQRAAQMFRALSDYLSTMFVRDTQIAFAFTAIVFWTAVLFSKQKITATVFVIVVTTISFIDLARVNKKAEEYYPEQNAEAAFVEPDYITVIKNQKDDQPFRLLNLKQDGSLGSFRSNSNFNSYFLMQDLYGYSSIKPRTYQDYMDVVGPYNETLWRMLNVKYLIFDQENQLPSFRKIYSKNKTFVYENTNVLPRAFFVDSLAQIEPLELLNKVKQNSFDPKAVSYTTDTSLKVDKPDNSASITITKYLDEKIELSVNATGNNLLFLGDTYYPNGWSAYIDGKETEIYRVNHGFRGIIVPQGEHQIEFIYLPSSFIVSKYAALSLSFLTILGLALGLYFERRNPKQ